MWNQEKINQTYLKIQNLSATDEAFRSELLKNPNAAISKISEEALPENFNIKVIENDPAYSATFVLPPMVSGEISDGDLEKVAGGYHGFDPDFCGCKNRCDNQSPCANQR